MKIVIDKIKRYYFQIMMIIIRNGWKKADFLKKKKIFYKIGDNCSYSTNILPAEPFLVSIHNNVIISAGVRLITHSAAHVVFNNEEKTNRYVCRHDKIEIKDNVYIGADAIINFGVTIEKNCIVAAGSIVTKNVPEGSVVAGVPAKVIGSYWEVKNKALNFSNKYTNKRATVKDLIKENPIIFDDQIINNKLNNS